MLSSTTLLGTPDNLDPKYESLVRQSEQMVASSIDLIDLQSLPICSGKGTTCTICYAMCVTGGFSSENGYDAARTSTKKLSSDSVLWQKFVILWRDGTGRVFSACNLVGPDLHDDSPFMTEQSVGITAMSLPETVVNSKAKSSRGASNFIDHVFQKEKSFSSKVHVGKRTFDNCVLVKVVRVSDVGRSTSLYLGTVSPDAMAAEDLSIIWFWKQMVQQSQTQIDHTKRPSD